ncbi:SPOSA6832_03124 [Sporobolomyces salmonicolor]|uniref:NEDD8-conjugating enzyme UBC12 n=1 Tax=Sporidiobolus salmonicolor TaxID=5005 RepID=A0A0D6EMZ1_SPOSA|nr:SPOSA6832_03124 [Sporobolomyces salmonicolor]
MMKPIAHRPSPPLARQIWSLKKDENAAAKKKPKTSAALIRVQKGQPRPLHTIRTPTARSPPGRRINARRALGGAEAGFGTDLTELDLPSTMKTHFPNPEDLLNFELTITPDEGMYKGGSFKFTFAINNNYPHEPPKVKCIPKVYHPNLDLDGNVCLNILREDWKPVLNLNAVMVGLQYLFLEPNADDPLNKDAANDLRANRDRFIQNVAKSMRGGMVGSEVFDDVRVH